MGGRNAVSTGAGNRDRIITTPPDGYQAPMLPFAVRSSATAEISARCFLCRSAGRPFSILWATPTNILHAIKEVFASFYNDRAIAYRVHKPGFCSHRGPSAGIQRMVRPIPAPPA